MCTHTQDKTFAFAQRAFALSCSFFSFFLTTRRGRERRILGNCVTVLSLYFSSIRPLTRFANGTKRSRLSFDGSPVIIDVLVKKNPSTRFHSLFAPSVLPFFSRSQKLLSTKAFCTLPFASPRRRQRAHFTRASRDICRKQRLVSSSSSSL